MRSTRFALAARTAGVLLVAVVLTFTMCHDTRASTAAETAAERMLLPSAGWNGRPIRAPHRHETVRTAAADAPLRGWSAGPVRLGAGFRHPGGSDRVREVQRRLARLGYRVGPADGLFGRRTRASVAWFQVKHGLPVNGRATLGDGAASPRPDGDARQRDRDGPRDPGGPGHGRVAGPGLGGVPPARRPPQRRARRARRAGRHAGVDLGADRPRRRQRPAVARVAGAAAIPGRAGTGRGARRAGREWPHARNAPLGGSRRPLPCRSSDQPAACPPGAGRGGHEPPRRRASPPAPGRPHPGCLPPGAAP